jgi:diketogulonate reductase-like aldo/keto reductase
MKEYMEVPPAVNQIEFHPFLYQEELLKYCKENNIIVEAHSPLAPLADVKSVPYSKEPIEAIAKKHGKTQAQVLLRFSIEHGVIPLPKSVHKERIVENLDVFDFELDAEDMKTLDSLNVNLHVRRDPTFLL